MNLSAPVKISIVICTHNRCTLLRDTLASLEQLSVPEDLSWNLVVVDNNSSDQTKDVVESFAHSAVLQPKYAFESNPGLSHARNRGIAETSGSIIAFLDDDVIVAPDWLTEVVQGFEQYGAMCVSGRVLLHGNPQMPRWWDPDFNVAVGKFDRGTDVIEYKVGDTELIGIGANMSFRRVVFEKYGPFNTEMGRIGNQQRTGEETELVHKLRQNGDSVIHYPRALVYHCIPETRFSKHYLRRNAYHFGGWRYQTDSETPSKKLKFLGVPLWRYRAIVQAAGMIFWRTLLGQPAKAFVAERILFVHIGYFMAAQKASARESYDGRKFGAPA